MRSLTKAEEPNSPPSSTPPSPAASPCTQPPPSVIPPALTSKQPFSIIPQASTSRSQPLLGEKVGRSGPGSVPLFMQRGNAKGLTLKCVNLKPAAGQLQVNDTDHFTVRVSPFPFSIYG